MCSRAGWATEKQIELLTAFQSDYDAAKANKKYTKFWPTLFNTYLTQFPLVEELFPGKSVMDLNKEEVEKYTASLEKLKAKLKEWYRWRANVRSRNTNKVVSSKDLRRIYRTERSRVPKKYEVFAELFSDIVKPAVSEACKNQGIAGRATLKVWHATVSKLWSEASEEQQEAVKAKMDENSKRPVTVPDDEYEKMIEGDVVDSPESYQHFQEILPNLLQATLDPMCRKAGMMAMVTLVGPVPKLGGSINTTSLQFGDNQDTPLFSEAWRSYDGVYLEALGKFAKQHVFPDELCLSRKLVEEAIDHDGAHASKSNSPDGKEGLPAGQGSKGNDAENPKTQLASIVGATGQDSTSVSPPSSPHRAVPPPSPPPPPSSPRLATPPSSPPLVSARTPPLPPTNPFGLRAAALPVSDGNPSLTDPDIDRNSGPTTAAPLPTSSSLISQTQAFSAEQTQHSDSQPHYRPNAFDQLRFHTPPPASEMLYDFQLTPSTRDLLNAAGLDGFDEPEWADMDLLQLSGMNAGDGAEGNAMNLTTSMLGDMFEGLQSASPVTPSVNHLPHSSHPNRLPYTSLSNPLNPHFPVNTPIQNALAHPSTTLHDSQNTPNSLTPPNQITSTIAPPRTTDSHSIFYFPNSSTPPNQNIGTTAPPYSSGSRNTFWPSTLIPTLQVTPLPDSNGAPGSTILVPPPALPPPPPSAAPPLPPKQSATAVQDDPTVVAPPPVPPPGIPAPPSVLQLSAPNLTSHASTNPNPAVQQAVSTSSTPSGGASAPAASTNSPSADAVDSEASTTTRRSNCVPAPSTRAEAMNNIGSNVVKHAPVAGTRQEDTSWFEPACTFLKADGRFGPDWDALIGKWMELEAAMGYGETAKGSLPVQGRPEEWKEWTGKTHHGVRAYDKKPFLLEPAEFGIAFAKWWASIQPPFRTSDGPFPKQVYSDTSVDRDPWAAIRKSGPNGFVSVLTMMRWWGAEALFPANTFKTDSQAEWKYLVYDITMCLEDMFKKIPTSKAKRKRHDSDATGKENKRRG